MNKIFVFCDESGNTGANYVDLKQPVYILTGWIVRLDSMNEIERTISSHFNDVGITSKDFKNLGFLKLRSGQKTILKLLDNLLQLQCLPLFAFAEKRYCICGKMVDTFLDPYFNPLVDQAFFNNPDKLQETADILYELPDNLLNEFAVAYRYPNYSGFPRPIKEQLNMIYTYLME